MGTCRHLGKLKSTTDYYYYYYSYYYYYYYYWKIPHQIRHRRIPFIFSYVLLSSYLYAVRILSLSFLLYYTSEFTANFILHLLFYFLIPFLLLSPFFSQ
jgi:hypothetical protein